MVRVTPAHWEWRSAMKHEVHMLHVHFMFTTDGACKSPDETDETEEGGQILQ